ncbi:MAG: MBOAT family protein [Acidobacteria bacterium]|jgi:alginate O-acetyltransferase complex protein AlgI|nr:MBOAT family protein [Acidobacteriota bacterium]
MFLNTPAFLFLFLPPVLLASLLLKNEARNAFLLLASLTFYAWGQGWLVLLLLGSALGNHLLGLGIDRAGSRGKRKALLLAALGLNLALLAACKYPHFIIALLQPLLRAAGLAAGAVPAWPLPLGVSFFTFMAMAYLIEVHNRAIPAERQWVRTALFISFFPALLSGPINRYSRLRQQLAERHVTPELLGQGLRRVIIGLGKKVLLADTLARAVDAVFAVPAANLTAPLAWLGVACFTLQIFLDFSGYSDMAIGLGRMFGFTFMENFNYPYVARSITDFWNRWHISLSSWLRDFIFLPAAYALSRRIKGERWLGIRADSWCYYPAMLLTMFLCGLWHGAAWTFIAWGLYHGLFIVLERQALKKVLKRLWPPLQTAYTLLVVACGWALFRAADLSQATGFWKALLGGAGGDGGPRPPDLVLDVRLLLALAAGLIAAGPVLPALRAVIDKRLAGTRHHWLRQGAQLLALAFLAAVLAASVMAMTASPAAPFIYFSF